MDEKLESLSEKYPHLRKYLFDELKREEIRENIDYQEEITRQYRGEDGCINLIYPLDRGDEEHECFVHIETKYGNNTYFVITPRLVAEANREKMEKIKERILTSAPSLKGANGGDLSETKMIDQLYDRIVTTDKGIFDRRKVEVDEEEKSILKYTLKKQISGYGILDPVLKDKFVEDIHCVSTYNMSVLHEIFGLLQTNLCFRNEKVLENYIRTLSTLMGKNVTESDPIADGALPDGSRVNIVYSKDISKEGSSFTIRRFTDEPISVTKIIDWGTLSPKIAAYMWLILEHDMSAVVSGVTASGKTTTMNSFLPFIGFNEKIYSAEDTPEVRAPQDTWQRLVTREDGPEETRVELFDLVKTALRSRPDYIVVGEVRGREGNAAFQAIQTGHPVMSTFHADSISKLIQRFTGDPINVPIRFMDNLNVTLFQHLVELDGEMERRCTAVEEILSYSSRDDGVKTRRVFSWNPVRDEHTFTGMNNSYVLEELVAKQMRLDEKREIYDILQDRADVLESMIEKGITYHDDVVEVFKVYSDDCTAKDLGPMKEKIRNYEEWGVQASGEVESDE